MRIIKKFNQYIKEDAQPQLNPASKSYDQDFEDEFDDLGFETEPGDEDLDLESDENELSNKYDLERDDDTMNFDDKETYEEEPAEEEEEGDYKGGRLMKELASKLGTQVVDNEIQYGGHTVTCPSEDDIFRIGKRKFRGLEDIYNFLKSSKEEVAPVTEKRKISCNCCEKCSGKGKCRCKNCKCK